MAGFKYLPHTLNQETDLWIDRVGARVRAARKAANLTPKELCFNAGLSLSVLEQLERGTAACSLASLRKIAAVLGVSMAALMDVEAEIPEATPALKDPWYVVDTKEKDFLVAFRTLRRGERKLARTIIQAILGARDPRALAAREGKKAKLPKRSMASVWREEAERLQKLRAARRAQKALQVANVLEAGDAALAADVAADAKRLEAENAAAAAIAADVARGEPIGSDDDQYAGDDSLDLSKLQPPALDDTEAAVDIDGIETDGDVVPSKLPLLK
jgi:transcriptional regulator with XRE-family HTH domain